MGKRTAEVRPSEAMDEKIIRVKTKFGEITGDEKRAVKTAYEIGKDLQDIKDLCSSGQWLPALEKTGLSRRVASSYMKIAKCKVEEICRCESIREAVKHANNTLPKKSRMGSASHTQRSTSSSKDETAESERETLIDQLGTEVPDRCRDAFADPSLTELLQNVEQADAMIDATTWVGKATKLVDHYQFVLIEKFREHILNAKESIQLAAESLRSGVPYAVCPNCNGGDVPEVCQTCRGGGHVPQHRYKSFVEGR